MRLTRKNKELYYTNGRISSGIVYIDDNKNFTNACIYKLGQLEDIEEELGIDLIALFKASKGIDIDEGNAIRENVIPTIDLLNKRFIVYTGNFYCPYKTYRFQDKGITWALTKEELL